MSVKVSWGFDPSEPITSFDIDKSIDKGLSYSALTAIVFDAAGPAFDRQTNRFFYNDATGAAGHIYKITAQGSLGNSPPEYAIAPPIAQASCLVIGYLKDAFGDVNTNAQIVIENYGGREERWADNTEGVVAFNNKSYGLVRAINTVFPNSDGIWQVSLIRKTVARVRIPELQFDWAFEVPDKEGPINVRDIKQLRGGSFYGQFPEMTGVPDNITTG